MYFAAALVAGICGKLYDDLTDNIKLAHLSSPLILETLKGIHYILFTAIALQEPFFWFVIYISSILHLCVNPSSYTLPYEKSMFYSGFIYIILLYNINIVELTKFDYGSICFFSVGAGIEPYFTPKEYSCLKLCTRSAMTAISIGCVFISSSRIIKLLFLYFTGYFGSSTIVQLYSLYKDKLKLIQSGVSWDELFK